MRLIYPNKPVEKFAANEDSFRETEGQWIAQSKLDGWRCLALRDREHKIIKLFSGSKAWARGKDKDLFFLSRRGIKSGGPTNLPVSNEIVESLDNNQKFTNNSMLDCEWLARRTIGEYPETLFVFDVLWLNNEYIGSQPYSERHKLSKSIIDPNDNIKFPNEYYKDFKQAFEEQKTMPWTEGIVIKKLDSKILPDMNDCQKNPLLIKYKWRSGDDGRTTFNL